MEKTVAIYLRLSLEDAEDHLESDSISSQRLLIRDYLLDQPDLRRCPTAEFVDDGFTGTNFDRPQFQAMLEQVRRGRISCVVVKDFSRFGRDYLGVGDYLEHIFPALGVRFISVNDHFDSADYLGKTSGIAVAFQNLVAQQYSRDLSQKVKSAMHLKMEKGQYVTHCPYGYTKPAGVKHQMIPDPETAPIVREIFLAAIDGKKSTEIAAMLNQQGVLTPQETKKTRHTNRHSLPMWSHQAILRILRDYKYTGAMVNFKQENATIRAKTQKKNRPEDWVVVEGRHQAIVTHEEYRQANAMIRKVRPSVKHYTNKKDRVYYCGHCGRRLQKTFGVDQYYSCATALYQKDAVCASIHWSKTDLEQIVFAAFLAQIQLMETAWKELAKQTAAAEDLGAKRKAVQREIARLSAANLRLYEGFKSGDIDKETFLARKTGLLEKKNQLEGRLEQCREEEESAGMEKETASQRMEILNQAAGITQKSKEEQIGQMYDWVDRVTVFSDGHLDIRWKFDDLFQREEAEAKTMEKPVESCGKLAPNCGKHPVCPKITQGVPCFPPNGAKGPGSKNPGNMRIFEVQKKSL